MASFDGISLDFGHNSIRTFLSSIGGFSQPARNQIRSLQDLLQTIQRLDLTRFDGPDLEHIQDVGEGVSYKVSHNIHKRSGRTVAVKQVKLPSATADFKAFERQVACVLRDVEVMACLSRHENILNMLGYGWNTLASGHIPFLVTEFAEAGTLRDFLKTHDVSFHEKIVFARDVAQGLHALHNCGIAHGDLKLDNVLVVPWEETDDDYWIEKQVRSSRVKACISDFGHSLYMLGGSEDISGWERYGGTLAYNAPEITAGDGLRGMLNFRKCDVWSLGLLAWEMLRNGQAYYYHSKVQQAASSGHPGPSCFTDSTNHVTSTPCMQPAATLIPNQGSMATIVQDFEAAAPLLSGIACDDAKELLGLQVSRRTTEKFCDMFNMILSARAEERVADTPLLPLLFRKSRTDAGPETSASLFRHTEQSAWSFEIFRRAPSIPYEVKTQILADCKRIAEEPGESISSAKAAFQVVLACLSGFGGAPDSSDALNWIVVSASKGLELGSIFRSFFDACTRPDTTPAVLLSRSTECFQQALRRKLVGNLEQPNNFDPLPTFECMDPSFYNSTIVAEVDAEETEKKVTRDMTDQFQLACRLGDVDRAIALFDSVDHTRPDGWGAYSLHWLFMFPTDTVDSKALFLTKIGERNWRKQLDAVAKGSIEIDPQLPIRLTGTPLTFATMVGSVSTVRMLLNLGADPLARLDPSRIDHSAWLTACKYHLVEIIELFAPRVRLWTSQLSDFAKFLETHGRVGSRRGIF